MGLRVNTNISALDSQRHLGVVSERLQRNFRRLASGLRISVASDDAAGLGISERMRSQIRSFGQAARNGQDGVSLVETAESALNEVNSNLVRMRELAIQAANGTYSTADRATLDSEFQLLVEEIDRIATTTKFNGVNVLNSSAVTLSIQVGTEAGDAIDIGLSDTTTTALGLTGASFDLTTASNATGLLDSIDSAIDSLVTTRGGLGATQNRIESAIRSIQSAQENLSAAESRIRDVDVASETADLTRNSIVQQAAVSILAQANLQPQIALSLLQG